MHLQKIFLALSPITLVAAVLESSIARIFWFLYGTGNTGELSSVISIGLSISLLVYSLLRNEACLHILQLFYERVLLTAHMSYNGKWVKSTVLELGLSHLEILNKSSNGLDSLTPLYLLPQIAYCYRPGDCLGTIYECNVGSWPGFVGYKILGFCAWHRFTLGVE